jgi:hypothetical protein
MRVADKALTLPRLVSNLALSPWWNWKIGKINETMVKGMAMWSEMGQH